MGVIRQLKNFFTGKTIYPKTLTKAVYDENGERLDKILRDTMLAVDNEEYSGVEPRDADTLGGKYTAKNISAIEDKLTGLNSSLNALKEENWTLLGQAKTKDNSNLITIDNLSKYRRIALACGWCSDYDWSSESEKSFVNVNEVSVSFFKKLKLQLNTPSNYLYNRSNSPDISFVAVKYLSDTSVNLWVNSASGTDYIALLYGIK